MKSNHERMKDALANKPPKTVVNVTQPIVKVQAKGPNVPPVKAVTQSATQSVTKPKQQNRRDKQQEKFRLPDGTRIMATYHESAQEWTVAITVQEKIGDGVKETTLQATQPGIHAAIMRLGRAWFKSQQEKMS